MEPIKINAIKGEKCFEHFGIHPKTASMFGYEPNEIIELTMILSKNQTRSQPNDTCEKADYWSWFDIAHNRFTMIYSQYFLLNMCFAYGIDSAEKGFTGKAYRLEIINESKY